MPLESGKSREAIGHNIKTEEAAGKKKDQAVAIALHNAGVTRSQDRVKPVKDASSQKTKWVKCPQCAGVGERTSGNKCTKCGGMGHLTVPAKDTLKPIPMGKDFEESKHPRANNGEFGQGSGRGRATKGVTKEQVQGYAKTLRENGFSDLESRVQASLVAEGKAAADPKAKKILGHDAKRSKAKDSALRPVPVGDDFKESDHPREDDGKFGSGGGGNAKQKSKPGPEKGSFANASKQKEKFVGRVGMWEIHEKANGKFVGSTYGGYPNVKGSSPDEVKRKIKKEEAKDSALRPVPVSDAEKNRCGGCGKVFSNPGHVYCKACERAAEKNNVNAGSPKGIRGQDSILRPVPVGDDFKESDHPREDDGKFGSGGGGNAKQKSKPGPEKGSFANAPKQKEKFVGRVGMWEIHEKANGKFVGSTYGGYPNVRGSSPDEVKRKIKKEEAKDSALRPVPVGDAEEPRKNALAIKYEDELARVKATLSVVKKPELKKKLEADIKRLEKEVARWGGSKDSTVRPV